MKKYLLGCALLLMCLLCRERMFAQAAKIVAGEYFFDADPGTGNAIPITTGTTDSVSFNLNIAASALGGGFHQLFIRFKDANNYWSIAEQRPFYVDSASKLNASKIIAGEYFFDTDPGTGNGLPITTGTTDSISLNLNIAATGLSAGFHQLFIRFKDAGNYWSIAEQRPFYVDSASKLKAARIIAGEYFFDTDPGVGNGNVLTVPKTDSVNKLYNISSVGLSAGFHQIFIRYKDSLNFWSIAEQRPFYVDSELQTKASPIVAAEYFFTKDSGVGKGTPLILSKTDSVNKTFSIVVPTLATSKQYLEIRFKDSSGNWSIAEARRLTIVCKPVLGNDTTVAICSGTTKDITGLYDYIHYASYNWNTATPTAVGPGTYRLIATSTLGCSDTAFVTVTGNLIAAKPDSISGKLNNLCGGGTNIKYSIDSVTNAVSYTWTVPANCTITSGQGTTQIRVTFPPNFSSGYITVKAVNKCGISSPADSIKVLAKPAPTSKITGPKKVSANQGGLVYSVNNVDGLTYTWTVPIDASITSGQATNTITVNWGATPGDVTVFASNSCGSSGIKNLAVTITSGAIAALNNANDKDAKANELPLKVYPNPARSSAVVVFNTGKAGRYTLELMDISGKVLKKLTGEAVTGENKVTIDVGKYAQGMYIINLTDDEYGKRTLKLNKQ